jgi:sigma-B regulation protein RsbU (phosphoserine phosphatase)
MVYRAATGKVEIFDVNGTLLGMMQTVDFEQKTIELEKGDKLFLYTDGINETMDTKNNFFGLEGLSEAIRAAGNDGLPQTLDAVIRAVHHYRGRAQVKDDIVILGFQIDI